MLSTEIILYAMLGGIFPAIFWLNFWLREDNHNEPRKLIISTFLLGMFVVFPAIVLEHFISLVLPLYTFFTFIFWASVEEILKFLVPYFTVLKTRFNNEPINATIYLITSALGFAALENTMFLLEPLTRGQHTLTIATSGLRFIGASLLHVLASSIIGMMLGLSFYKNRTTKIIYFLIGLFIAVIIHALFNTLIINFQDKLIFIFSSIWIGIIFVILLLERIKKIKNLLHN